MRAFALTDPGSRWESRLVRSAHPVVARLVDAAVSRKGVVRVPGVGGDDAYRVHDLIDDTHYEWRGDWNYVRFDPDIRQGHILWLPKSRI